jgi:hypothetical protein
MTHSLPTTVDVPYGLDFIIRSRQRNVVNRQYHSPAWHNQPHLMPLGNELAQVTTLQLYLQQLSDCERAGILIDRAPGIKILAIEFENGLDSFKRAGHHFELQRDIVRNLFQSVNSTTPRAGLESLRIRCLTLDELLLVLPRKLPLRNLKHLHLVRCRKAGPFIQMLTQTGVDFASYHVNLDPSARGFRRSNEALLHQMTSPKRIHLSSMGKMVCDWAAVTASASSLLSFSVDDENYDNLFAMPPGAPFVPRRSTPAFFDFCSAATSLEQLAISSPPIETEHWNDAAGLAGSLVSICTAIRDIQSNTVPGLSQSGAYPQGSSSVHRPGLLERFDA